MIVPPRPSLWTPPAITSSVVSLHVSSQTTNWASWCSWRSTPPSLNLWHSSLSPVYSRGSSPLIAFITCCRYGNDLLLPCRTCGQLTTCNTTWTPLYQRWASHVHSYKGSEPSSFLTPLVTGDRVSVQVTLSLLVKMGVYTVPSGGGLQWNLSLYGENSL